MSACDRVVYIHPTKTVPEGWMCACGVRAIEHRRIPSSQCPPNMLYLVEPGSLAQHQLEAGEA